MSNLPRIMLVSPQSGAGKTTVVCAILAALKRRNLKIGAFKCGPDYIDPMFHKAALGIDSRNLDSFLMGEAGVKRSLFKNGANKDICVIEGVMGYYDGLGGISTDASAYHIHQLISAPVILLVDCKGLSLSVAAIIKGFMEFRKDSGIVGVILNRISPVIYQNLKDMLEKELPIQVLGFLPNDKKLQFESRHLGLIAPNEQQNYANNMNLLADAAEKYIDLKKLIALANAADNIAGCSIATPIKLTTPLKIAVARDEAFSFYYEDNLDLLQEAGCELLFFSPLHDKSLPKDVQGLLLGGGYPEIFAEELSKNYQMLRSILQAISVNQIPTIAECGGFLYLHDMLEDESGQCWEMVRAISGKAFKTNKLVRFGYAILTALEKGFIMPNEKIPCHNFHYWNSQNNGNALLAQKPTGTTQWRTGHMSGTLWAGFSHIHFYQAQRLLEGFLRASSKELLVKTLIKDLS